MSTAATRGDLVLSDRDRLFMTRSGWFPKTDFPVLEEMREHHEALVVTRDAKQNEISALIAAFQAEDEAERVALRAAYARGEEDPEEEGVATPPEERAELLADARKHVTAASEAVMGYAEEMLLRLRGDMPADWNPHHAAEALVVPPGGAGAEVMSTITDQEREAAQQRDAARRAMEEADQRMREMVPLKVWLARNANGAQGQIEPGTNFLVPDRFTYFSKPRDTPDPPHFLRQHAEGEGAEFSLDDTDEERMFPLEGNDEDEAWFQAMEARTSADQPTTKGL
jgi:hypothetical protein